MEQLELERTFTPDTEITFLSPDSAIGRLFAMKPLPTAVFPPESEQTACELGGGKTSEMAVFAVFRGLKSRFLIRFVPRSSLEMAGAVGPVMSYIIV